MTREVRNGLIAGFGALVLIGCAIVVYLVGTGTINEAHFWHAISAAVALTILLILAGMAAAVVVALANGTIDLTYLLAEPADPQAQASAQAQDLPEETVDTPSTTPKAKPPETPKASLSRFQLLIFTFVIAGLYLALSLETGTLIDIPENVLLLLGISGTTYAASKTIKAASDRAARSPEPAPPPVPAPAPPPSAPAADVAV